MSRGLGEAEFAAELPDIVVAIAGLVTQLGDAWFVLGGIVAVFVGHRIGLSVTDDPWRDCLFLFAIAVGSYSLTVVLKHAFALTRPLGAETAVPPSWLPSMADAAYASMVTGDGYGFPSGHALKTTAVYGGAAVTLRVWERRRRVAVAVIVTVLVASSRVFLGVHYLADVFVGVAVGAAFLAVLVGVTGRHPGRALVVATGLGLLAFGASFSDEATLATATAALGLAAWTLSERSPRVATFVRGPVSTPETRDDSV